MPSAFFRYLLPHNKTNGHELIYFPYWRFKGMLFSCAANQIENRFVDTSQQALQSRHFPVSAGLRPQVGKLVFATKDAPGRFIRPKVAHGEVFNLFKKSLGRFLSQPIHHQAYIGEAISLMYAPFYVTDRLYDAVLNKPITQTISEKMATILATTEKIKNETRFFPALCPACGWDLGGEKDAAVLLCQNCQTTWQPTPKGFTKLPYVYLSHMGDYKTSFPFWRIQATVEGLSLETIADFARVANLSGIGNQMESQQPFYFWVPAFKVRPKLLITLCQRLTMAQPDMEGDRTSLPAGKAITANLPATEASQMLKVVLAGFARPAKNYFPRLKEITITPRKALLAYIPFDEDHHDYIQPQLRLGVGKRLLTLANNL